MSTIKKKTNCNFAIRTAKRYLTYCRKMGLPVSKAILFGSMVKGNARHESDVDLLIVSEKFGSNTLENWKMLAPVSAKVVEVEPHPYSLERFNSNDPFIKKILEYGIEVPLS